MINNKLNFFKWDRNEKYDRLATMIDFKEI